MKQYTVIRNDALSPVDLRSQNATGVYLAKDVYAWKRRIIRLKHILGAILEIIWTLAIVALAYYILAVIRLPL